MAEFGGALDRWLEGPYVDAARRQDEFEQWAEANNVEWWSSDAAEAAAWESFEQWCDSLEQDIPEPPDDWDRDPRDHA